MSNTYFKIEKEVEIPKSCKKDSYTNSMELTLTAFMGKENVVQLTVHSTSTIPGQSGIGYIVLDDQDIDKLIFGLLERKLHLITSTGDEQSLVCPNREDNP